MANRHYLYDEETGVFTDDMYLGHLASKLAKQNRNRKRRSARTDDWSEQEPERSTPRRG